MLGIFFQRKEKICPVFRLKRKTGFIPLNNKYLKGFTLVELLVVIALISLIVAVVLSNMTKNKNSARDIAVRSSLSGVQRAAALLYSKTQASYEGVCDPSDTTLSDQDDFGRFKAYINKNNGPTGVIGCKDSDQAYAVISSLNLKDCWCVDSTGNSKEVKLNGAPDCRARLTTTACP